MGVFRSHMDKILEDLENSIIITNPKERVRTFFRRMIYTVMLWLSKIKK